MWYTPLPLFFLRWPPLSLLFFSVDISIIRLMKHEQYTPININSPVIIWTHNNHSSHGKIFTSWITYWQTQSCRGSLWHLGTTTSLFIWMELTKTRCRFLQSSWGVRLGFLIMRARHFISIQGVSWVLDGWGRLGWSDRRVNTSRHQL